MNRYKLLTAHAVFIIITGVVLMFQAYTIPTRAVQYVVAAGTILSGVFALLTAYKSVVYKDTLKYHVLHAIVLFGYGVAVLFFANDVASFLVITEYFLFFYGVTELVFCAFLMAVKSKPVYKIVATRMVIGFSIIAGAVMVLAASSINRSLALLLAGLSLALSGIVTIVFKSIIRKVHENKTLIPVAVS
ncbi:MAG: hypothetical protein H7257_00080 [Taibaiella sp.]|nr:hypothetical protein [Taibaiella sp.]